MNGAQYKNVIKWTLAFGGITAEMDSQTVTRTICKNLGVSYPHGNNSDVVRILNGNRFLGWTPTSCEDAQRFADLGVAAIGVSEEKTILICPSDELSILTDLPEPANAQNEYVKHTKNISPEEQEKLQFFAYCYGHVLDKEK